MQSVPVVMTDGEVAGIAASATFGATTLVVSGEINAIDAVQHCDRQLSCLLLMLTQQLKTSKLV